jgi:hypothetical protein
MLCATSLALALVASACRRAGDRHLVMAAPIQAGAPGASASAAMDPALRLAPSVRSRWTGMKIGVIDLSQRQEATYLVSTGQDFTLPGGGLTFRILALVPDFTLDNGVITSRSDSPRNPAAQVLITENGRQLYRGWLFARFPDNQPFEHPRYAIRLLELVPSPAR